MPQHWKWQERAVAREVSVGRYPEVAKEYGVAKGDTLPFRRTPMSGAWSRNKAPCDIIPPEGFPFLVECKAQNAWSLDKFLKTGTSVLFDWFWKEEKNQQVDIDITKPKQLLLVFRKGYCEDMILLRKEVLEWYLGSSGYIKEWYQKLEITYMELFVFDVVRNQNFVIMKFSDFLKFDSNFFKNKK